MGWKPAGRRLGGLSPNLVTMRRTIALNCEDVFRAENYMSLFLSKQLSKGRFIVLPWN
jgi:hypothetical protein